MIKSALDKLFKVKTPSGNHEDGLRIRCMMQSTSGELVIGILLSVSIASEAEQRSTALAGAVQNKTDKCNHGNCFVLGLTISSMSGARDAALG